MVANMNVLHRRNDGEIDQCMAKSREGSSQKAGVDCRVSHDVQLVGVLSISVAAAKRDGSRSVIYDFSLSRSYPVA